MCKWTYYPAFQTVTVCHLRKLQIATGADALNNNFITAQLIAQEVFTALSPEVNMYI
jgi:hypothetical protein